VAEKFLCSSLFRRQVVQKLSDSEYLELQVALILQPELGDLIPDSGGCESCVGASRAVAKASAVVVRIIYYYWYSPASLIYFLVLYSKADRDDLSAEEKKAFAS